MNNVHGNRNGRCRNITDDPLLSTGRELGAEIKKLDKPAKPARAKQPQAQEDAEAEQARMKRMNRKDKGCRSDVGWVYLVEVVA